ALPAELETDQDLADHITLLAGQINAANHRLLKLIAEFDRRKGWSGGGTLRSCAHWLNWKCGIALVAARERVRVAHCLENLPQIDAAFAAGEISYSKVRAMTRVATPANEDYLLYIARQGTASHVEQVVKKYRGVCQKPDQPVEQEQENQRELLYYQGDDGMWIIHAKLPPEAGSLLVKAIEAIALPGQQAAQKQAQNDSAESFSPAQSKAKTEQFQHLLSHTRADALVAMSEHFLATYTRDGEQRGLTGSERCQVMLHVDINTLRQHSKGTDCAHEHCHLDNKTWLSPDTARRLACDASLLTVLEDENGEVLNIGRRSRTVPAHIGRALKARDKTCRFPGCCESRYVDFHHIQHWADGGETSLDNLVTLCRYHHRQLHSGSFSISASKNKGKTQMTFLRPSGEEIESSFYPQFPHDSAESSAQALSSIAPGVDKGTAVTNWRGEDCDFGMAVDALFWRDGGSNTTNTVCHSTYIHSESSR
ncbi:HNH endonuclease, partial [Seongchinamella sediminis]